MFIITSLFVLFLEFRPIHPEGTNVQNISVPTKVPTPVRNRKPLLATPPGFGTVPVHYGMM